MPMETLKRSSSDGRKWSSQARQASPASVSACRNGNPTRVRMLEMRRVEMGDDRSFFNTFLFFSSPVFNFLHLCNIHPRPAWLTSMGIPWVCIHYSLRYTVGRIHAGDPRCRAGQNMHIGTTTERIVLDTRTSPFEPPFPPRGIRLGTLDWCIDAVEIRLAPRNTYLASSPPFAIPVSLGYCV